MSTNHSYNLNDWGSSVLDSGFDSVSKSHVPMVGQTNNKNYYAVEIENDNGSNCSNDTSETPTDIRTRYRLTSWHQNNQEIKYNKNFKICAEVSYAIFLTLILFTFIGAVIGVWYGSQIVLNGIDHNQEDTKENCYLFDYNNETCYYECNENTNQQCEGNLYTYYAISMNRCGNQTVLTSEYKCPSTWIHINTTVECYISNCQSFSFSPSHASLLGGIVIICVCTFFILIACFAWFKSCSDSCKVCF